MESRILVGNYHRFGDSGVVYQITSLIDSETARICVLETEEETDYPISLAYLDPQEQ